MESVNSWLFSLGLREYSEQFETEGFDSMYAIREIKEADLEAMKVKRGHRRVILKSVEKLNAPVGYSLPTHQRASFSGLPPFMLPNNQTAPIARHRSSSLTSPQELAQFTLQNTFFPQVAYSSNPYAPPANPQHPASNPQNSPLARPPISFSAGGPSRASTSLADAKSDSMALVGDALKRGKGRPAKQKPVLMNSAQDARNLPVSSYQHRPSLARSSFSLGSDVIVAPSENQIAKDSMIGKISFHNGSAAGYSTKTTSMDGITKRPGRGRKKGTIVIKGQVKQQEKIDAEEPLAASLRARKSKHIGNSMDGIEKTSAPGTPSANDSLSGRKRRVASSSSPPSPKRKIRI